MLRFLLGFWSFSRCLTYIGRCGPSVRFISSKERPNPSPGELKQTKKPSRKILDSRREGASGAAGAREEALKRSGRQADVKSHCEASLQGRSLEDVFA